MWQSNEAIHTNLERLLEVDLPQKNSQQSEDFNVTCCICYSDRLNGQVPSRTCDNPKCGQSFHIYCLYEVKLPFSSYGIFLTDKMFTMFG